jgi:hypothetical protein
MSASAYGHDSLSAARAAVRRAIGNSPMPVRPVPVGDGYVSEVKQPIVGRARSLDRAEALCRAAGYRMVRVGGLCEPNAAGTELLITVADA